MHSLSRMFKLSIKRSIFSKLKYLTDSEFKRADKKF